MKIKQTIYTLVLASLLVIPFVSVATAQPALAATCGDGVETAIINCDVDSSQKGVKGTAIWELLLIVINILTAGVGVVALAGIVYGAVLYSSAGGNPEQVKKARTVFTNVVIGVVAFGGMYALLNFIIPGGIFE